MTSHDSLLSFIAHRHTVGLENVATDALFFILFRSASAKWAFSEFLGDDHGPLPITEARPWPAGEHGAVPDLACVDEDGEPVVLVESKFWAALTRHQPATYWQGLPSDRPAVLLFLAPDSRVDQGPLWDELVNRLNSAGYRLGPAHRRGSVITSRAGVGQRRLMLASWQMLLDAMLDRGKKESDTQACFEIAELQRLVDRAIYDGRPNRDENLKRLIGDALKRVVDLGWASTDGLGVSRGFGFWGRYLRLAGAAACLGIDYKASEQMPGHPLWLSFYSDSGAGIDLEAVRNSLGSTTGLELEWRSGEVCVPITLPTAADQDETLDAMVAELERIAVLIDPNGPTYGKATDRRT